MVWKYEKFKGNGAIYAFCPKCNFHHNPSNLDCKTMIVEITFQYNYCPMCGEYLHDKETETDVDVTWDEREIAVLYEEY